MWLILTAVLSSFLPLYYMDCVWQLLTEMRGLKTDFGLKKKGLHFWGTVLPLAYSGNSQIKDNEVFSILFSLLFILTLSLNCSWEKRVIIWGMLFLIIWMMKFIGKCLEATFLCYVTQLLCTLMKIPQPFNGTKHQFWGRQVVFRSVYHRMASWWCLQLTTHHLLFCHAR